MEKPSLGMSPVFVFLAIFVIGILAYISVLGENHKIDRVINSYFDKLKDGMYLEACESFSSNLQEVQRASDEQLLNFNFLVELSLLKYYGLIDHYDYTVKLERNHFWIPLISEDSVRVSVLLRKKGDKGVSGALSQDHSRGLSHNLIVVGREKGSWKIKRFNIADSPLADIYNDLRQSIDLNKYTKMTARGFRLQDTEINFKTLTPIDKRLLRFSLYKIQQSLNPPDKKAKGSSPGYPSL
jgi:hypothetical protein